MKALMLSIIGAAALSAFAPMATAMIGQTPDQVIAGARRDKDTLRIEAQPYGGCSALQVYYRDQAHITHVFGRSGREIGWFLIAPKRLINEQVFAMQRMYKTRWEGAGVKDGVSSYQSQNNLYMGVQRGEMFDMVTILDQARMDEMLAAELRQCDALRVPAPPSETNVYPPPQQAKQEAGLRRAETAQEDGVEPLPATPVPQQQAYLSTDPAAGLSTQPAPSSTPVIDPDKKDCLIVATDAYARLKNTAHWLKMAAFTWSEKGRVIGGHAVVFYQPTENSNVFMYDAGGSYDLFTQSHDLDEIVTALNRLLQKTAIRITMPRWLDTEGSREEFAVSKSDRQPV
jgi:hypothetical protein